MTFKIISRHIFNLYFNYEHSNDYFNIKFGFFRHYSCLHPCRSFLQNYFCEMVKKGIRTLSLVITGHVQQPFFMSQKWVIDSLYELNLALILKLIMGQICSISCSVKSLNIFPPKRILKSNETWLMILQFNKKYEDKVLPLSEQSWISKQDNSSQISFSISSSIMAVVSSISSKKLWNQIDSI